jgi:hypothetical protein
MRGLRGSSLWEGNDILALALLFTRLVWEIQPLLSFKRGLAMTAG